MRTITLLGVFVLTPLTGAIAQEQAHALLQKQPVAQEPSASPEVSHRAGGWFGIGLTFGSLSGADLFTDNAAAFSLNLRAGGTVSPHLRIGGELDLCLAVAVYEDEGAGFLATPALTASVYPSTSAGFFLKAGIAVHQVQSLKYGDWNATAFAPIAGVGYDLRRSGRSSLTLFAQLAKTLALLGPGGAELDEWPMTLWQLGVSFVWH
jgi:hypothetical protein